MANPAWYTGRRLQDLQTYISLPHGFLKVFSMRVLTQMDRNTKGPLIYVELSGARVDILARLHVIDPLIFSLDA